MAVDKYLAVVMAFLAVGVPIAFISPSGGLREAPFYDLFYASIAGICIIIVYSSYRDGRERRRANAKRKRPKKG